MIIETKRSWAISNFRESAVRVFLAQWFDFEIHSKGLNTSVDEVSFQQLQGQYVAALREQLHKAAERCLGGYAGDRSALRNNLNDQVAQNVSAFIMKANSLFQK